MKASLFLSSLALALLPTQTFAVTLAYDTVYDNAAGSLSTVACSDGANGLLTRGFTTFGSLPSFPNIGAAEAITGWNSTACGSCWEVTFTNSSGIAKSLNITAIDVATPGFVLAQAAMDELTNNNAVAFGRVDVTSRQVNASACGL
uniref:Cerato-platanin 6 n=1 Tax=Crinipellis campanella TaxID=34447 RepID=S4UQ21_9AGAR|nr:cerato-platanin 6 [Crinipellis campanella]